MHADDMQTVQIVLYKDEVARLDELVQSQRRVRRTRSAFLRALLLDHFSTLSLPDRSSKGTSVSGATPAEQAA